MGKLLIKNIGQLATPTGFEAQKGSQQGEITCINQAAIVVEDGLISYAGKASEISAQADTIIDAGGC
jgi:imidazolonepropionase